MKKLATTSLLVLALFLSRNTFAGQLDPQIEAIQNAYKNASDISTDFTQKTYIKLVEKDVIKKGKMFFKRGGKFRIAYDGADEKTYISDGNLLWVFVPNDESSIVTYNVNDDTVPKEAMKFLSSFDNLNRDFIIEKSDSYPDIAPQETALFLKPKSRKAHFESLDARFNEDNILSELIVHNKSGNVSRYTFSNIKLSSNLDDKTFSYGSGKATPDSLPQ